MKIARMRIASLAAGALLAASACAGHAETVERNYSYFSIGGATLAEIDAELTRRGPHLDSTGQRHPGATRMEFGTRVAYRERNGRCAVADVSVRLTASMILPRWRAPRRADGRTRQVWEVLSADIRRHEEEHVAIARRHAASLEKALAALGPQRSCAAAERAVKRATDAALLRHDREQARFDLRESRNFERRILGLLNRPGGQPGG